MLPSQEVARGTVGMVISSWARSVDVDLLPQILEAVYPGLCLRDIFTSDQSNKLIST